MTRYGYHHAQWLLMQSIRIKMTIITIGYKNGSGILWYGCPVYFIKKENTPTDTNKQKVFTRIAFRSRMTKPNGTGRDKPAVGDRRHCNTFCYSCTAAKIEKRNMVYLIAFNAGVFLLIFDLLTTITMMAIAEPVTGRHSIFFISPLNIRKENTARDG